jgi:hypothetical protein
MTRASEARFCGFDKWSTLPTPSPTASLLPVWTTTSSPGEDVPVAVELRSGDPVSELSQAGVAATSGAVVVVNV